MRVEILYFAILRERAGRARETLDLPDDADVRAARAAVAERHPEIAALLPRVQVAVNRTQAPDAQRLADGDEVALLPPVAGGAGPRKIAILDRPLLVDETVEAVSGPHQGGVVTFTGVVRRQGHHLPDVVRLEYEAYAEMAEEVLADIAEEIEREWPGTAIAIHHRVGALAVGEIAVAITAASAHRAPAFEACRAAIDRLKERAPIWKKEIGESGEAWLGLGA
ncbi:MAG TPA: molybdopterin converting factor subunit 1 [Polyangia bacterium]